VAGDGKVSGKHEIPVEREGNYSAGLWQLSRAVPCGMLPQDCSPMAAGFGDLGLPTALLGGLLRTEGCPGSHRVLVPGKGTDPEFCWCAVPSVTPHF